MELDNLLSLTIEMMKVIIEQLKAERISCDEFNKHAEIKIRFIKDNFDRLSGSEKAEAAGVLDTYEDLNSPLRKCI